MSKPEIRERYFRNAYNLVLSILIFGLLISTLLAPHISTLFISFLGNEWLDADRYLQVFIVLITFMVMLVFNRYSLLVLHKESFSSRLDVLFLLVRVVAYVTILIISAEIIWFGLVEICIRACYVALQQHVLLDSINTQNTYFICTLLYMVITIFSIYILYNSVI